MVNTSENPCEPLEKLFRQQEAAGPSEAPLMSHCPRESDPMAVDTPDQFEADLQADRGQRMSSVSFFCVFERRGSVMTYCSGKWRLRVQRTTHAQVKVKRGHLCEQALLALASTAYSGEEGTC